MIRAGNEMVSRRNYVFKSLVADPIVAVGRILQSRLRTEALTDDVYI